MIWLNVIAIVLCGFAFVGEASQGNWRWFEAPLSAFFVAINALAILTLG